MGVGKPYYHLVFEISIDLIYSFRIFDIQCPVKNRKH